jgi:hypothetical protein
VVASSALAAIGLLLPAVPLHPLAQWFYFRSI